MSERWSLSLTYRKNRCKIRCGCRYNLDLALLICLEDHETEKSMRLLRPFRRRVPYKRSGTTLCDPKTEQLSSRLHQSLRLEARNTPRLRAVRCRLCAARGEFHKPEFPQAQWCIVLRSLRQGPVCSQ